MTDGVEPPPSRYPHIADGTLVAPEKLGFPKIPGVHYSTRIHKAYRADYGPKFVSDGITSNQPPKIGTAFAMLVPAVDADGNEVSGIRLPELAVPLATYTGWNLFNAKSGPTDEISSMVGSYIPLPRTAAERKSADDPRRSIEERYPSREDYLGRVERSGCPTGLGKVSARSRRCRGAAPGCEPLGLSDARRGYNERRVVRAGRSLLETRPVDARQ